MPAPRQTAVGKKPIVAKSNADAGIRCGRSSDMSPLVYHRRGTFPRTGACQRCFPLASADRLPSAFWVSPEALTLLAQRTIIVTLVTRGRNYGLTTCGDLASAYGEFVAS